MNIIWAILAVLVLIFGLPYIAIAFGTLSPGGLFGDAGNSGTQLDSLDQTLTF